MTPLVIDRTSSGATRDRSWEQTSALSATRRNPVITAPLGWNIGHGAWTAVEADPFVDPWFQTDWTATARTEDSVPTHVPRDDDPRSESDEVRWLHEQSGLTWEQLGRLFGVSRRTVHLWANGSGMNATNREALYELVALVRSVQGETPGERRRSLLSPDSSGRSQLDTFRDRRLADEPINRPAAYAAEALDTTLDPAVRES